MLSLPYIIGPVVGVGKAPLVALPEDGNRNSLLAHIVAGVFMMLKLSTTYDRGAVMVASGIALRRGAVGMKAPTASELSQAGTQCSICHVRFHRLQGCHKLCIQALMSAKFE